MSDAQDPHGDVSVDQVELVEELAGAGSEGHGAIASADAAEYAMRLGDDALVLAQQLGMWITRAPELEEDVALGNIGLDLIGHARSLLHYAGSATGRSEDDLAYWRDEPEWPLARTDWQRWYLHSGGNANTLLGDGTLSPQAPGDEPPDRYVYHPELPVPTRGGGTCCSPHLVPWGPYDQLDVEMRGDVLCCTSAPLEHDL